MNKRGRDRIQTGTDEYKDYDYDMDIQDEGETK